MHKLIYLFLASIFIQNCSNTPQIADPIPKHENFTIQSTFVNEARVINVWTPPNYNLTTDSFPVLYMPDGGIKEDFPHIANTLAQLIDNKNIPPIILVGIENTERGRDLTGFSETKEDEQYCPLSDGAKNFRAFITQELMPDINAKYKTTHKKGIIGESLAGLFVMETFFLTPESFDFYIAMDPSLWWNNHYLEKNASTYLQQFPNHPTRLWFAGSGAEDISTYTNKLAETLQTQSPSQLTWKYEDEPNEKHNTIFRATKVKALKWVLNETDSEYE